MTTVSSSTSSTATYSTYTKTLRETGLASGIDTSSIVSSLMKVEAVPLNKVKQEEQLAEWKIDAYQSVTSLLSDFSSKYFDVLNSDTYMLKQSTYDSLSCSSSDDSVVTATSNSSSGIGTHTITVSQVATAAVEKSSTSVSKNITADSTADISSASGKSLVISVDGTKKTITIDSSITTISGLQDAVDSAFGSGKIKITDSNGDGTGTLLIKSVADSGVSEIALSDGTNGALSDLGFGSGSNLSNRISTSDTLEDAASGMANSFTFDSSGNLNLKINGVSFSFSKSTTLSAMMKKINNSDAGVTMKYDTTADKFIFTANDTGAGNNLNISETGSTFLTAASVTDYTAGKDAVATIDGEKYTRSSNSITTNGVTYKLVGASSTQQKISASLDTTSIYDKIKDFVTDYNTLISTINSKLSETYDRSYKPLTDDQKSSMTDTQITNWETKAKTGMLENDSTISNMLTKFRTALYSSVSGVSKNLSQIGITTSSSYDDKGKLEIDTTKLKAAIESDPEGVVNLFCQESETYSGKDTARSLTSTQRTARNKEEGIAYRIYDILQDNISTIADSSGNKGLLLEKAGKSGDSSNTNNYYYNMIKKYNEKITTLTTKLNDKETYYYNKFTAMETALSNLNTQASWLTNYSSSSSS